MRILNNHGKGAAQVALFHIVDIEAIVGDGTAVNLIEAVDQIDNGSLSGSGGADKSNLLAGLGIQINMA